MDGHHFQGLHVGCKAVVIQNTPMLRSIRRTITDGRLSRAAERGNKTAVDLLLARSDVKADSKDNSGRTPLSWAAWRGSETVVSLLLAHSDIKVNSKDNHGWTPLSWAVARGDETVTSLLLARRGQFAEQ